jgi:hypothetical protein
VSDFLAKLAILILTWNQPGLFATELGNLHKAGFTANVNTHDDQ